MWTLDDAAGLCREIEAVAPAFGCHVALTGGVLYKDGPRKDLDLVFYRIRQVAEVDVDGLFRTLEREVGIQRSTAELRWCIKATYGGRKIDCFFPEIPSGDYDREETTTCIRLEKCKGCSSDAEHHDNLHPSTVELPRFDIGEF